MCTIINIIIIIVYSYILHTQLIKVLGYGAMHTLATNFLFTLHTSYIIIIVIYSTRSYKTYMYTCTIVR